MANISLQDYFMKNFICKNLGMIASKEFPNSYENFVKNILYNLKNAYENEPTMVDNYLRIILYFLEETDDRISLISGEILSIIINVFKVSNV